MERNNVIKDIQNLPEGWKRVRLGEVIISNKNIAPKGSSPYLEIGDIDINSKKYFIKDKPSPNHCIKAKKGEIIISKVRPTRGAISIIKEPFLFVSPAFLLIDFHNSKFLFYSLSRTQFFNFLGKLETGTTYPSVNDKDVLSYKLPLPPLPEQQKIAEILETVDNAIEKTDKIIEKYKRIKQGLMQDLLTKGIDENGNIRSEKTHKFKDSPLGRIPEEWEVVELGEVFKLKSGMTKPIDTSEFGNYPVYGGNGILGYTNEKNFNIETIIIGRVGEYCGSVYIANEGWVTDNALYVVAKKIDYNNIFLCYLLKYLNLNQFSAETGQPLMTQTIIYRIQITLPPLPEQERIAEILSQIDKTIEKEEQYKEKLKRIKQGLMEDLLTGKVRVNHLIKEGVENVLQA
ncbi:MAG: restriction endonuclease subunit S [Candidatus Omnitrophica bacterium]|nr:restriction endonuclease subunit S [Candidatus Omnitrophota bacterium]